MSLKKANYTRSHARKGAKPALKVISGKNAKRKSGKVVELKSRKKDDGCLSPEKIESLILDYRANARKLSRSILRRWHARLDLEELDSLVDLALCEAARRYNPKKGASFMTFLFYHLRGCLVRAVDAAANTNTVPAASFEINELSSDYNGDGSAVNGNTASDIAEALCNQEYLLPDELLYKKEVSDLSNTACANLDSLEQEVIHRIYAEEQPLVDIARALGYSRCHISRVKKRALELLHANLSQVIEEKRGSKPNFEDDEDTVARRPVTRRKLRRQVATLGEAPLNAALSNLKVEANSAN